MIWEPIPEPFLMHPVCKQQLQTSGTGKEIPREHSLGYFVSLLLSEGLVEFMFASPLPEK